MKILCSIRVKRLGSDCTPSFSYTDEVDLGAHIKVLSLLESTSSGVGVAAAAAGDASILRNFLTSHPQEVYCIACLFCGRKLWNCLKIDFGGENFCRFAVTQFATPTNVASECDLLENETITRDIERVAELHVGSS